MGAAALTVAFTWLSVPRIKFQVLCEMPCSAESPLWKVEDLYKYSLTVMCFSKNTGCLLLTSVVFLAQWYSFPQGISLRCEMLCPRLTGLSWRDDRRWEEALPGAHRTSYWRWAYHWETMDNGKPQEEKGLGGRLTGWMREFGNSLSSNEAQRAFWGEEFELGYSSRSLLRKSGGWKWRCERGKAQWNVFSDLADEGVIKDEVLVDKVVR